MQGTLQDFGLAEILQLMAMQQKTGLLRVQNGDKLLTFYFEGGILVSVRDRRRIAEDPLLEYLKSTGYLDAWQVLHLKLEVEENRTDLAEVLLEKNLISEEELMVALNDLALDLIHRTYTWRDGAYRFISGDEALRGLRHKISHKMEGLLLESARRSDEWPSLRRKLPGPAVLLSKVESLPDYLDERSRDLLSQLRGPMRLGELVECGRMPEYDVYETVAAAVEADLVRILEAPPPEEEEEAPKRETPVIREKQRAAPRRAARVSPSLATLALAAWGVLVGLGGAVWMVRQSIDAGRGAAPTKIEVSEARAALARDLEVYRALRGAYPTKLDDLVRERVASPDCVQLAHVDRYAPDHTGRSYRLALESVTDDTE
jgi:hypothetical protein